MGLVALATSARQRGALALVALVCCVALAPLASHAQAPVDVSVESQPTTPLPGPPEGYEAVADSRASWVYPTAASSEVRELRDALPGLRHEIGAALGATDSAPLFLRVATGPESLQRLAPADAPPPAYATGVAYPARGLILLSLTAPESGVRPDMRSLLLHELAHVALHRRVRGASVPRWFTEGLVVQLAGEQNLERIRTLWGASSGDNLLPLSALSNSFPSRASEVNVAYAQSADLVGYLMRRPDGRANLSAAFDEMARGTSFDDAIEHAYGMSLGALDAHWRSTSGSATSRGRWPSVEAASGCSPSWCWSSASSASDDETRRSSPAGLCRKRRSTAPWRRSTESYSNSCPRPHWTRACPRSNTRVGVTRCIERMSVPRVRRR